MKKIINFAVIWVLLSHFLAGCNRASVSRHLDVVVAPSDIEYGDSFNVVLALSNPAGAIPELVTSEVDRCASFVFVSSHQQKDLNVVVYKVRPKVSGPFQFSRKMISVPPGAEFHFEGKVVNVASANEGHSDQ